MTSREIQPEYKRIIEALDQRELQPAFEALQQFMAKTNFYLFKDELVVLQENYKQLLHYYLAGSNDPMRQKIFTGLIASVYEMTDKIMFHLMTVDSPELFFSIRRMATVQKESIVQLTKTIHSASDIQNMTVAESLMIKLFNEIWTSNALSEEVMNCLQQSLLTPETPDESGHSTVINCQIISALTLGLQAFFDKRKMQLLILAAGSADEMVKIRAYTGLLLTLYQYKNRMDNYPDILFRIEALSENEGFNKVVYTIILRFILSKETEKITAKMQNEILPEMLKLSPKLNPQSSSKESVPEFFDIEMNPEWIENFEKSPLGRKIEEFSKLQEEGADVMHFSFENLKHFPFFKEINNWFMPFDKSISFLADNNAIIKVMEIMTSVGLMCNSDLYSFFFSIKSLKNEGREGMIEKMESQLAEYQEQKKADLQTRFDKTEQLIGHYIQDLYRFYKLFSRRKEFFDIFTYPLDFHNLPVLNRYFSDRNDLLNIAEYYLRKNHFEDALNLFLRLSDSFEGDEMLFQKKGYCLQMTGDYEGALKDYTKAELINPQSKWLLRRIAQCYRAIKKPEVALDYYFRLEKVTSDDLSVLLNIGSCYLEMKNYADALKYYFKVDYLDPESGKAKRPIAWISFLTGKFEQARHYYQQILASNPGYLDYTNAGHTEWALNQLQNAFDFYLQSIRIIDNDFETFHREFVKDLPTLSAAGINTAEIPFLLDKLRYSLTP